MSIMETLFILSSLMLAQESLDASSSRVRRLRGRVCVNGVNKSECKGVVWKGSSGVVDRQGRKVLVGCLRGRRM